MEALIKCDACGFETSLDNYSTFSINSDGIEVKCIQCPECEQLYPFVYVDKKQRELHAQIASIAEGIRIKRRTGKLISPARQRELNTLIEAAKSHQSMLRDTHIAAVTEQLKKFGKVTNT